MNYSLKTADINLRDPFILPDNGKYYLYGSGVSRVFGKSDCFSVYLSEDLENWSEPKTVFEKHSGFWGTKQFWAPEVHKYNGKYYMFATFKSGTACRGTQILIFDATQIPYRC